MGQGSYPPSISGPPLSSAPPSRRPSSRQASFANSPFRTSVPLSRAMSRAPSLGPAYEVEGTELQPVLSEEGEEQVDERADTGGLRTR